MIDSKLFNDWGNDTMSKTVSEKVVIELTVEQLSFLQDRLHDRYRADKDEALKDGKESGLSDTEIFEQWKDIQAKYKDLELAFSTSLEKS